MLNAGYVRLLRKARLFSLKRREGRMIALIGVQKVDQLISGLNERLHANGLISENQKFSPCAVFMNWL
jgi:hypothetical protein